MQKSEYLANTERTTPSFQKSLFAKTSHYVRVVLVPAIKFNPSIRSCGSALATKGSSSFFLNLWFVAVSLRYGKNQTHDLLSAWLVRRSQKTLSSDASLRTVVSTVGCRQPLPSESHSGRLFAARRSAARADAFIPPLNSSRTSTSVAARSDRA